jgi:hypothetical protein
MDEKINIRSPCLRHYKPFSIKFSWKKNEDHDNFTRNSPYIHTTRGKIH